MRKSKIQNLFDESSLVHTVIPVDIMKILYIQFLHNVVTERGIIIIQYRNNNNNNTNRKITDFICLTSIKCRRPTQNYKPYFNN